MLKQETLDKVLREYKDNKSPVTDNEKHLTEIAIQSKEFIQFVTEMWMRGMGGILSDKLLAEVKLQLVLRVIGSKDVLPLCHFIIPFVVAVSLGYEIREREILEEVKNASV